GRERRERVQRETRVVPERLRQVRLRAAEINAGLLEHRPVPRIRLATLLEGIELGHWRLSPWTAGARLLDGGACALAVRPRGDLDGLAGQTERFRDPFRGDVGGELDIGRGPH